MITRCRHCERCYWRYRPDHPPRFFCSVACHDARGHVRAAEMPRKPRTLLVEMHSHRRLFHGVDSILTVFEDCEKCEELECLYLLSLAFYTEHPESPAEPGRTADVLRQRRRTEKQTELIQRGASV